MNKGRPQLCGVSRNSILKLHGLAFNLEILVLTNKIPVHPNQCLQHLGGYMG
ncbi:hypothetical protein Hanom_Chr09g00822961 [Helianthus anomalus]